MNILVALVLSQTLNPNPVFKGTDGGWTMRVNTVTPWYPDGGYIGTVGTPLDAPGSFDSFGTLRVGQQLNQIDIPFFRDTVANLTTVTVTGTGGTSTVSGAGVISTGAGVTSSAKAVSITNIAYRGGSEIYAYFTASFTTPTSAASFQRIGLYDTNNGFFIGYEGTTFKATVRDAAVDTGVAKAAFNLDTLTGAAGSKFTRLGVPEAINLAYLNVYRVRLGWLGAAPIEFEVLSPDGQWVIFHRILYPNSSAIPSIDTADLPMTMHVSKTASDATDVRLTSGCWAAGTTTNLMKLTDTLTDGTLAQLSRSVITGVTTGGGGGYVNAKVTPSGALVAEVTGPLTNTELRATPVPVSLTSTTVTGSVAVTGPLTDAQLRASAVPVSGTVAATQSGTWSDTPRQVATANNTGTCTSVTGSTTVLASNASRRAYGFKASDSNTATVHCKLGATATTSNMTFAKGAGWSQDTGAVYTGVIDCIAASGTQSVCAYEVN